MQLNIIFIRQHTGAAHVVLKSYRAEEPCDRNTEEEAVSLYLLSEHITKHVQQLLLLKPIFIDLLFKMKCVCGIMQPTVYFSFECCCVCESLNYTESLNSVWA